MAVELQLSPSSPSSPPTRHPRDGQGVLALASGEKTAELQTDSGAPRRCAAATARRLPDPKGADYRGGLAAREDAEGWTVSRPAHGAPRPGQTEAGPPGGEEATGRSGG
ncbi:unnamed protein product [Pleuronectes platessa]|uniref:Uncharacterized protein n=1 Tax=Pleuronectes platessa TaxID=8262 RepID=A0A9N7VIM8_PLEPL|nr:unnamed protein product [Pleuronectes platessa]